MFLFSPHPDSECLLTWLFVFQHIVEWCDGLCSVRREGDSGWERAVDDLLFTVSVSGWREVGGREGGRNFP